MKKGIICLGLFTFLMVTSCINKEQQKPDVIENNTVETKTVEKETVIVRDSVKPDGTTIKVNGDGVEVNSKDVDVEIKK